MKSLANKLTCLIRKREVSATKEERVRQSFLGNLLYSLNYPESDILVEVPIYHGRTEVLDVETSKRKRADIVVYEDSTHTDIKIIVEVKKEKEQAGEEQVKSYGNVTNARYLAWHNGYNPTKVWKRIQSKGSWKWKPIPMLPHYGMEEGDIVPNKSDLREIENVKGLFTSINNMIWVNSNIKNKREIFLQFLYVLFAKLYDEYFNAQPQFYIVESEYAKILETSASDSFEHRIFNLFSELKGSADFKSIFDETDKLTLEPRLLAEIIYRLQFLKIRDSDTTGEAFQLFISPYYRGENDQYLTPESVIKMILGTVNPTIKDTVLDPACGTGRFLTYTINYVLEFLKKQNINVRNWASTHVFGIDIDKTLVKISKIYMVMIGDGHTNITKDNSLNKEVIQYGVKSFHITIAVTNPPFGRSEKVIDKSILKYYDLGHVWDEDLTIGTELRKQGQTQGVLMLERAYQFLEDDGIIGIVLPEGLFSNLADDYIRKWIVTHFEILAIVSLPEETFRVETIGVSVKTSVLIAKKKSGVTEHNIFFALPRTIGYNQQGEAVNSNEVIQVASYYHNVFPEIKGKYFRLKLTNETLVDRMDCAFHSYQIDVSDTFLLGDKCDVFVGKTPSKSDYLDAGKIKILKVRSLTNKMVDWSERKRDYVTKSWYETYAQDVVMKKHDILLASAAHMAKYIGDEIDIVDEIPSKYEKVIASAKLNVIRVRTEKELNPFVLLLYLRTNEGYRQIQSIVRGQTAEVYPQDILRMKLPNSLLRISKESGSKIEEQYENALKNLKSGEKILDDIQSTSGFKRHGNILHVEV